MLLPSSWFPLYLTNPSFPGHVLVFLTLDGHSHAVCPFCKQVCPTPASLCQVAHRLSSHCSGLMCDISPHPTLLHHMSSPGTWHLISGVGAVGMGKIWFPSSRPTPCPECGQELSKRNLVRSAILRRRGTGKKVERK